MFTRNERRKKIINNQTIWENKNYFSRFSISVLCKLEENLTKSYVWHGYLVYTKKENKKKIGNDNEVFSVWREENLLQHFFC